MHKMHRMSAGQSPTKQRQSLNRQQRPKSRILLANRIQRAQQRISIPLPTATKLGNSRQEVNVGLDCVLSKRRDVSFCCFAAKSQTKMSNGTLDLHQESVNDLLEKVSKLRRLLKGEKGIPIPVREPRTKDRWKAFFTSCARQGKCRSIGGF